MKLVDVQATQEVDTTGLLGQVAGTLIKFTVCEVQSQYFPKK